MQLDLVHVIDNQLERGSELRFRAGVGVLIVVAVLLVMISLGLRA